jgi:GNAT superfamily N-acetyltransferase
VTSVPLRDSRLLEIEVVSSDDPPLASDPAGAIASFIVDPLQPWFSAAEQEFLAFTLRGEARPSLRDAFVVGRLDGRIVGASWHGVSATHPAVAVVGFVRTAPDVRRLGIARALTSRSLARAWADGAEVVYLGTNEPGSRRLYESIGFRVWSGVVMRADRPGRSAPVLMPSHALTIRAAEPGDVGAWTHLLVALDALPWRIRSWSEDVAFAPPGTIFSSCVRPSCSTFLRWRASGVGSVRVAVDERGLMAAAASVLDLGRGPSGGTGTLEFLAHAAHLAILPDLIRSTIDEASAGSLRQLVAYSDAEARTELLERLGFQRTHVLPGAIVLDGRPLDVAVLRLPL